MATHTQPRRRARVPSSADSISRSSEVSPDCIAESRAAEDLTPPLLAPPSARSIACCSCAPSSL
eukprot:scaffold18069_cov52-Phaeocystis_antarctica.AAC.1